jgi:hypothetical protein
MTDGPYGQGVWAPGIRVRQRGRRASEIYQGDLGAGEGRRRAGRPAAAWICRHEAGSRFNEAGVLTNYASKLLGLTNLTTTSRYLNIHRRGLHLAMRKLES